MCRQKYLQSEDLARAAELQVQQLAVSTGTKNRCYVPRENHTRGLRKQRIPARLFAVLDAIRATCHGNKPGTRFATNVVAEWTKKQCFVSIETISRLCYELLNRLII